MIRGPGRHNRPYREWMTVDSVRPRHRFRRSAAAVLLAVAGLLALNGVALGATPAGLEQAQLASGVAPPRLAYRLDLSTDGYYIGQYTYLQCVGASVEMMRNMVLGQADHSAALQHLLFTRARQWSRYSGDGGADPFGWAAVLTFTSAGPYAAYGGRTAADTIHALARAMALSGRPVGVTVWYGSHAWVISGITATDDPARTDDFSVLTIAVTDPLWTLAHHHGVLAPSTWLTVAQFSRYFQRYHDPKRSPAIEGRYVAILPVPTSNEVAAAIRRPSQSLGTPVPLH